MDHVRRWWQTMTANVARIRRRESTIACLKAQVVLRDREISRLQQENQVLHVALQEVRAMAEQMSRAIDAALGEEQA